MSTVNISQALSKWSRWIASQRDRLNNWNLFPFDDHDTGTNLRLATKCFADCTEADLLTILEGYTQANGANSSSLVASLVTHLTPPVRTHGALVPRRAVSAVFADIARDQWYGEFTRSIGPVAAFNLLADATSEAGLSRRELAVRRRAVRDESCALNAHPLRPAPPPDAGTWAVLGLLQFVQPRRQFSVRGSG